MHANDTEAASHTVQRQHRYEQEITEAMLEVLFTARDPRDFQDRIQREIFSSPKYTALPKYRQVACEAYLRAAIDVLSKLGQRAQVSTAPTQPPPPPGGPRRSRVFRRPAGLPEWLRERWPAEG